MSSAPMHTFRAGKMARTAQVGAGAVALLAAGLWAFQIPGMQVSVQEPESATVPDGHGGGSAPAPAPALNAPEVAEVAARLDMARKKADPVAEKPADPGLDEPVKDDGGWKYLGSIVQPDYRVALVSIGGKQKILRQGSEVDGVLVVDVGDGDILVSDDKGERLIEKAPRPAQGGSVGWSTPVVAKADDEGKAMKPVVVPGGGDPRAPKVDPNQERAARWMADPQRQRRIEQWRNERERRRREAMGDDGPRAPGGGGRGQPDQGVPVPRGANPQRMNGPNGAGGGNGGGRGN